MDIRIHRQIYSVIFVLIFGGFFYSRIFLSNPSKD